MVEMWKLIRRFFLRLGCSNNVLVVKKRKEKMIDIRVTELRIIEYFMLKAMLGLMI